MIYSDYVGTLGIQGPVIDCGLATGICPGNGGHICFIGKPGASFYTKALNCVNSGAVAVIIYNDIDEALRGTMGEDVDSVPQYVEIPVVGVKSSVGERLQQLLAIDNNERDNNSVSEIRIYNPLTLAGQSTLTDGYERKTGTSMSAPLVAGLTGFMWRRCPRCSREDVIGCLFNTTDSSRGSSDYYGRGVVQGDLAYQCIVESPCCLNLVQTTNFLSKSPTQSPSSSSLPTRSRSPSLRPTKFPAVVPTRAPSSSPTKAPSSSPTKAPSRQPTNHPSLPLPTRSPNKYPTRHPSIYPTNRPSSSPTSSPTLNTTCADKCTSQFSFCVYRSEQLCKGDFCHALCSDGISEGVLSIENLEPCQQEWCLNEAPCTAMGYANCHTQKQGCQSAC